MRQYLIQGLVLALGLIAGLTGHSQVITGVIYDESGATLPGATVQLEGNDKGVFTDMAGSYTFEGLNAGEYTVAVSYIGYNTQKKTVTLAAGATVSVDFNLAPSTVAMEEAVIVGYGVQRKREVVGSISKIEAKDITDMPAPSFDAALQGKAAGTQIIQSGGVAGSGSRLRIRGTSSLSAGGEPLYVVDGIPITQDPFLGGSRNAQNNNPLNTINPADIESIQILKDASAVAIYGSRGSNGVVLITTKRGSATKGKPEFTFSTVHGTSNPTNQLDFANGSEWLQLKQEAWENDGNVGLATLPGRLSWDQAQGNNTDWWDLMTRTGYKQSYDLGMRIGWKKFNLYAGLSYSDQESFILDNSFRRAGGRVNMDFRPSDKTTISLNTSLYNGYNEKVFLGWSGGIGDAMSTALPIYPVYNENGTFWRDGSNPVAQNELHDLYSSDWRTINNLIVNHEITDRWSVNINASYDFMYQDDNLLRDQDWSNPPPADTTGSDYEARLADAFAELWHVNVNNGNVYATTSYDFQMPEYNTFRMMGGIEGQKSVTKGYQRNSDSTLVHIREYEKDNDVDFDQDNVVNRFSFLSYFSRANYSYKDKFFAQATGRVDGSSIFGRDSRYGFFPSVGVSYVVTEDFLQDNKVINFMKVRTSWGRIGSSGIPVYQRWGYWSQLQDQNTYNNQPVQFPTQLENRDLSWETTRTIDFGVEVGLFNDRVTVDAGYYDKRTEDVLVNATIQSSIGFANYFYNLGEVKNAGFEVTINTYNINKKNFTWRSSLNFAQNRNEVLSIGDFAPDNLSGSGDTRILPGLPVGVNYLNVVTGVDEETGLPIFETADNGSTTEFSRFDRKAIGDVQPDLIGGFDNDLTYKNWNLSFLWVFTLGGQIYDDAAKRQMGVVTDWNIRTDLFDRWRQPGDQAAFPILTGNPDTYGLGSVWEYNTSQWLYDASYARLRNVTLGYTMNPEKIKRFGIGSMRIYAVGTNLVTLTKFPGLDPEIVRDHDGPQARNLSPNVTYLSPPQERTLSIGIDVKF